jgi:hypothetical protein
VADRENSRLQLFDRIGAFKQQWVGAKDAQTTGRVFCVAADSDGNYYVGIRRADYDTQHTGVVKLDRDWRVVTTIGFGRAGDPVFNAVHDLAVGKDGSIYVADTNEARREAQGDLMTGRRILAGWLMAGSTLTAQQPRPPDPLIDGAAITKVSDHVYVIPDRNVGLVPNVGIIVGARATLVVDTGLGPRNGRTVVDATNGVSRNADLYVVSTHFHPEHALGEPAFPPGARLIRAQAQQKDIDEFGLALAQTFAAVRRWSRSC